MADTDKIILNQPEVTNNITPQQITVVPQSSLEAAERRRDWALFIAAGGGFVMSIFAACGLFLLQSSTTSVFWLAESAMLNIFVIFTGILALLAKRSLNLSRTGLIVSDSDKPS